MTDRQALLRNRARALRDPALFLHEQAAAEIEDRLSLVNRGFRDVTVISGFPGFWSERLPQAAMAGDAPVLDLAPASQDLIVHAMALHWADDPAGQLIQCRHALRPDGLMIAIAPGGRSLHELRASLAEAESRVAGGLSPRVAPMGEIRDYGALLQRAGLALPVADSITLTASYPDPFALMRDLRAMGEGNALAGRLRRATARGVLAEAARIYHDNFATPDGRIPATFELIVLTGWAPDASQPQPLRPGSATHALADVLGTTETKLGD